MAIQSLQPGREQRGASGSETAAWSGLGDGDETHASTSPMIPILSPILGKITHSSSGSGILSVWVSMMLDSSQGKLQSPISFVRWANE